LTFLDYRKIEPDTILKQEFEKKPNFYNDIIYMSKYFNYMKRMAKRKDIINYTISKIKFKGILARSLQRKLADKAAINSIPTLSPNLPAILNLLLKNQNINPILVNYSENDDSKKL